MKTVLVTGATDGIGREIARQLLAQGWRVIVHGRTRGRAERTMAELARASKRPVLEAVAADLSRMSEVVALAEEIHGRGGPLDVLINNAGVYEDYRMLTADGFETTLAVNYFAPFLLTLKLLDLLEGAPQGRVITLSSIAHGSGFLDLEDLSFSRGFSGYEAYAASKLANILFTRALARRLADTRVTVNCVHPGVISTKLLHKGFGIGGAPVAEGARTPVYLASADEVGRVSGDYFIDCARVEPAVQALDDRLAEALWQKSELLLRSFL